MKFPLKGDRHIDSVLLHMHGPPDISSFLWQGPPQSLAHYFQWEELAITGRIRYQIAKLYVTTIQHTLILTTTMAGRESCLATLIGVIRTE